MDSQRPNDVSPEAMQARIQQARREAEGLKDRIKRKKDELADTSRMFMFPGLTALVREPNSIKSRQLAVAQLIPDSMHYCLRYLLT